MRETPLFKQCPNCQQFSPEESDVCLQCGHNFTPVQAPTETSGPGGSEGLPGQPPEMPEEQASKKKSSGLQKLALGALVIVVGGSVLLCVIGLTVAALLDDSPDSSTLVRPTYTPVPTFTSTPVGSTVTETTGQSDTQIQAQPTETLAPSRPVSSTPVPSTATLVPPTPVPPTATPTPKPIVTINNDMNVRGGPGTNYPIIGTASPGQQYPITGKNPVGDWWKINYKNKVGWVYTPLVTATNSESVKVAVRIPPTPKPPTPTRTPRPARPTATVPIPLSQVEGASVWISLVNNEYGWLEVYVQVSFEVDTYDLDVLIHGKECSNDRPLYDNEPATEVVCGILEYSHSSVSDVRMRLNDNWWSEGERERYRCERNKASSQSRSVFACERVR